MNPGCDLSESITTGGLTVGVNVPTKFTTEGASFRDWREMLNKGEQAGSEIGNHLAILIPCWAYILSEFLVETQGHSMEYTNISASSWNNGADLGDAGFHVCIGNADSKETRWWMAILASGQGWRPIISTSSDTVYLAPWSMAYHGDPPFFIETLEAPSAGATTNTSSPPSSEEALQYLTSYCFLHHLGTQYFAALSAALILPLQNLLGRQVQLPPPVLIRTSWDPPPLPDVRSQMLDIPHLVTLSCATRILSSALWSIFWEPEIDCNLASAWLFPISETINKCKNEEVLVRILGRHRPTVGPLWLGATLTGLSTHIPHFLRTLEAPYARPDSLGFAWLGIPQLFMDIAGTGGYICDGNRIRRADRWRLLHDVGTSPYGSTPLSSWQPFGQMCLSAVELDVGAHITCIRHEKLYTRWEWFGRDGISVPGADIRIPKNVIVDPGLQSTDPVEEVLFVEPELDESASIAATRSMFAWLTVGGEGWGESERSIFEHHWMTDLIPSDTDESASNGSWEADGNSD